MKPETQEWISKLKERGVDYTATPAEDYSNVAIEFKDPETGIRSISQATNSWMYDAPGLRLLMEAFGPGYSYTVNSLQSPAGLFISDAAAAAVADSELALEKFEELTCEIPVQIQSCRIRKCGDYQVVDIGGFCQVPLDAGVRDINAVCCCPEFWRQVLPEGANVWWTVIANDSAGNLNDTMGYRNFTVQSPATFINITQGWNLISLPFIPLMILSRFVRFF